MKYFLWLIRIVVGVLFIFSGLVKANDPFGLAYKMNEVFEIWHIDFMSHLSLTFSLFMIAFEIIAGVALLLGYAFRVFSFLLLLLNLFYTFLTGYALFTGKIKECGCFGACIPLSNTATFYKDVVLLILSIILFANRRRIMPIFTKYPGTALMVITTFLSFGIQWWALEHLPFYDCLPYKTGNNMWQKMQPPPGSTPDQYQTVMIYQKDGIKKEFTMQNYPWQDSTWKFVDRKDKLIKKGNSDPEIKDFTLTDTSGTDHTKEILTAPGYTYLLFVKDPATARTDNMERIQLLLQKTNQKNIPIYVITSGSKTDALTYQHKWHLESVPFFTLDNTVTKTAMRSNPGLMLLKDGVIEHKWSFRDYPVDIPADNAKPTP
ncbi:MAG: DoxX family protein [Taibaiella sp.]|nr:DoxX family protein [Taibaiella sp.]